MAKVVRSAAKKSVTIGDQLKSYYDKKAKLDKLKKEVEAAQKEILAQMDSMKKDTITADGYEARRSVSTFNKFDTEAFKADHIAEYNEYCRPSERHYFKVIGVED